MKALDDLRRFLDAKDTDEERHEVRAYVLEFKDALAKAFGTTPDGVAKALMRIADDERLTAQLRKEIERARRLRRDQAVSSALERAQASADVLATCATWRGDAASIDLVSVLASVRTRPGDVLVFEADAFSVAIGMDVLTRIARLDRVDLTATVDAAGLHVRWPTGGLNLVPTEAKGRERVVFSLSSASSRRAA